MTTGYMNDLSDHSFFQSTKDLVPTRRKPTLLLLPFILICLSDRDHLVQVVQEACAALSYRYINKARWSKALCTSSHLDNEKIMRFEYELLTTAHSIGKDLPVYAHFGVTHRCNLTLRCGIRAMEMPKKS